jgi:DNA-binding transcriptional LysR family regulator
MSYLSLLESFVAVYRTGAMTRAAQALNLTQPAVSSHIQALEVRLGGSLFARVARGVVPLPAGHDLARSVVPHIDALHALLGNVQEPTSGGTVHLGGVPGIMATKVLPALARLTDEGVRLRVRRLGALRQAKEVALGHLDLGVVPSRVVHPGTEAEPLYRADLLLVGNASWADRLRKAGGALPGAFAGVPLVEYDQDVRILEAYWKEVFGESPKPADVVLDDLPMVVSAVEAGAGVAVLPSYMVEGQVAAGRLLVLHNPLRTPHNTLFLIQAAGRRLSPPARRVRDALLEAAREWERTWREVRTRAVRPRAARRRRR